MIAEVISIGDELTSGLRLDTNSQWISQQLGDLGVRVLYHTTVADDLAANERVFRQAVSRADIVVATGGLGPTADDLTRDALARVAEVELVLDESSLEHIRRIFARFSREMPQRNTLQAMFPAGSRSIPNPHGTAPGIAMEIPRPPGEACRIFALPGVPAEMHEMFRQTVAPAILSMAERPRIIRHRRMKCFGAGESQVEQLLPDLIVRGHTPEVGITVHEATITLRITADGETEEDCFAAMEPTVRTIHECLGTLVFGEEDDELEDAVVRLLVERGQSLASVEWATTGLVASWLSGAARGRENYAGGLVVLTADALAQVLGCHMHSQQPDSKRVVEEMAIATRNRFDTDYALAIGAFPDIPVAAETPEPFHYALAAPDRTLVRSSTLAGHPSIWKPRAAKQALNLLRLMMMEEG